ncbi:hypothetical protein BH10BAC5_BH10BAC5_19390 [soil metagenome]
MTDIKEQFEESTEKENKIFLDSVGALPPKDSEKLHHELEDGSPATKELASSLNNSMEALNRSAVSKIGEKIPSADLKSRIMSKIGSLKKNEGEPVRDFSFIFADSKDWFQHPEVEAIQVKVLSIDKKRNYAMILMKAAPDCEYPEHEHTLAEECLVIEGDLHAEGKILGPGDFHHAEPGTHHGKLYTKNGCTLLLVVDPADYGLVG